MDKNIAVQIGFMRRGGYILNARCKGGSLQKGLPFNFPAQPSNKHPACATTPNSRSTVSFQLLPFVTIQQRRLPMKDLVAHIARELGDKPEEVSVAEVEGNQTSVLELKVAKDDLGKVIGKRGRIAHAIRTIVSSVSAKEKKRTVLEILD